MAPSRKRKTSPGAEEDEASAKRRFAETETTSAPEESAEITSAEAEDPVEEPTAASLGNAAADRMARFKALKARQAAGMKQNAKEVQRENERAKIDPELVKKLDRKNAIASHKLLKEDTEADGSDFERWVT